MAKSKLSKNAVKPIINTELNFDNLDFQIQINEERLKSEMDRFHHVRGKIGTISISYSVFAVYFSQIYIYCTKNYDNNFVLIPAISFIILLAVSIVFTAKYLFASKTMHASPPSVFYKEVKQQYIEKNVQPNDINEYVKRSYLDQLETCVDSFYNRNNTQSNDFYWAFLSSMIALIPFLFLVGLKITEVSDEIQKIQIIN